MKSTLDVVWSVAAVAGVLGLGFVLGRMSVRVDDQDLRDSLAVYRHQRTTDKSTRDSLVGVILLARTQVDVAEADAAQARAVTPAIPPAWRRSTAGPAAGSRARSSSSSSSGAVTC